MCQALEPGMEIRRLRLLENGGGQHGAYRAGRPMQNRGNDASRKGVQTCRQG
jgi:hypothetical protein